MNADAVTRSSLSFAIEISLYILQKYGLAFARCSRRKYSMQAITRTMRLMLMRYFHYAGRHRAAGRRVCFTHAAIIARAGALLSARADGWRCVPAARAAAATDCQVALRLIVIILHEFYFSPFEARRGTSANADAMQASTSGDINIRPSSSRHECAAHRFTSCRVIAALRRQFHGHMAFAAREAIILYCISLRHDSTIAYATWRRWARRVASTMLRGCRFILPRVI